jgi:hypothetical protein
MFKFLQRLDDACEDNTVFIKRLVLGLFFIGSLYYLLPVIFSTGVVYSDDSAAFIRMANNVVEYFQGVRTWHDAVIDTGERTLLQPFILASFGWIFDNYDPRFYVFIFWMLTLAPVPFLMFGIVDRVKGPWPLLFTPLLFLSDPSLANLAAFAVWTDVPPITTALAGFYFLLMGWPREDDKKLDLVWLLLAGAAFGAAIAFRWHTTISLLLPGIAMLFIAYTWPWRKIHFMSVGTVLLAMVVTLASLFYLLDFIYPMRHGFNLVADHKNSMWAYGNGGIEKTIDNVFLFRIQNNIVHSLFDYIATNLALLIAFLLAAPGYRRYPAIYIGIMLYICMFLSLSTPLMLRYIQPVALVGVLTLAFMRFHSASGRPLLMFFILLAFVDTTFSQNSMQPGPLNQVRADAQLKLRGSKEVNNLTAPVSLLARGWHEPFDEMLADIRAERKKEGLSTIKVFGLTPPSNNGNPFRMKFYYQPMALAYEQYREARDTIIPAGIYFAETALERVYRANMGQNYQDMLSANLVLVTDPETSTLWFSIIEKWPEWAMLKDIYPRNTKALADIGLGYITQYDFYNNYLPEREAPRLYRVADRVKWMRYVDRFMLTSELSSSITPDYRLDKSGLKVAEKDALKMDKLSMASSVDAVTLGGKEYLRFNLLAYPYDSFYRIFVHLVPPVDADNKTDPSCPFRSMDHDVKVSLEKFSLVETTTDELKEFKRCNYLVRVGVKLPGKPDLFDFARFTPGRSPFAP